MKYASHLSPWFHRLITMKLSRCQKAVSLVELLVCVVIVAILSGISLTYYQGAVDYQDLKYTAPQLAKRLDNLREQATGGNTVEVTFHIGEPAYTVTWKKAGEVLKEERVELEAHGLLKRPHRFRKYEWADGETEPATMTFAGDSKPLGGAVTLGTAFAEVKIRVSGSHVISDV